MSDLKRVMWAGTGILKGKWAVPKNC